MESTPRRVESRHNAPVSSSSLVVVAAAFLFYAVLSRRLDGTPLTAAMIFVGVGFFLSNEGLDWLHLDVDQEGVQLLAEATLAVVLFTDASRIDLHVLRREYGVPTRLLAVGLPLTIVAGSVVGALLFDSITWTEAVVVAIVLAPTDAALGQAVVTNPGLPSRIRLGLNVESGLNDGLCVPLLAIALAIAQADSGQFSDAHAATVVAKAIGWGLTGGVVAGLVAAQAVKLSRGRGWIDERWLEVIPVVAAAGAYGIADSLGGSGFIAAFVGGALYGRFVSRDADPPGFSEELGGLLSGITFIVFGGAVLSTVWSEIRFVDVVYAVLSLTLVRMVPVALAMFGSHARAPTVWFLGWFGPRGLASIVFGVVIVDAAGLPHTSTLIAIITVTVALSVFAHGMSASPLARRYASWHAATASPMESAPAHQQRWRHGFRRRTS
jgi:NhaP-type Na+/H+ or K+/H+ antiporter